MLWEKLTARERQVAELLCQGAQDNEIAIRLGITRRTVKAHVSNIRLRLGIANDPRRYMRIVLVLALVRDRKRTDVF